MKRISHYLLAFCLLVLSGCEKYLTQVPLDVPTTGQFFNNETEMNAALNAVYRSVYWDGVSTPIQSLMDLWTDIGVHRLPELAEGNYTVFNAHPAKLWANAYTTIQRSNTMLEGMSMGRDRIAPPTYDRLEGEVRTLRAWAYLYLTFMFGEAPLITKSLTPEEYYNRERTPHNELVTFLYQELDRAAQLLPWAPTQRGRVSRAVALGLKARVALYNGDFAIATEAAKQVMDGAGLGLNPEFGDLFTKDGQEINRGKEIMWVYLHSAADPSTRTLLPLGSISRSAGGLTSRFPQQRLVDMFEAKDGKRIDESAVYDPRRPALNRDKRLKYTIALPGDTIFMNRRTLVYDIYSPTTSFKNNDGSWSVRENTDFSNAFGPAKSGVGLIWSKYSMSNEDLFSAMVDFIFIRYAEVFLTYAEAKIELNQLDASVIDAINQVRRRAGQPVVPTEIYQNQNELRKLIRRERTVELAREGFRWFDIRRWGIAEIVMPQQVMGVVKDPAQAVPVPNFKMSPVHDLNSIPTYAGQEAARLTREMRYWYPKLRLLPVPQAERDLNKVLSQNPGW